MRDLGDRMECSLLRLWPCRRLDSSVSSSKSSSSSSSTSLSLVLREEVVEVDDGDVDLDEEADEVLDELVLEEDDEVEV